MTDWKLQGSLPPLSQEAWEVEFERYKRFPEWQQRKSMTIEDFKFIYFWEYGHRMMGRFIGFAFTGPLLYFAAKGMIPKPMLPKLGLLFTLGGTQGLIGWWMVKSGLEVDPEQRKEIRVSPYRLATHLGMAFTTYTALLWTGLDLTNPASKARQVAAVMSETTIKNAFVLRKFAIVNGGLVAATVISGAFVAGNDAGNAYNTFPLMDGKWIPSEIMELEPKWRNLFENTATVQFDHRVLAISTLTSMGTMYVLARKGAAGSLWAALPSNTKALFHSVAAMSATQVGLGIGTLLLYVPIPLAAVHQAGSLVLLTLTTLLAHSLRFSTFAGVKGLTSAATRSVSSAATTTASTVAKNLK